MKVIGIIGSKIAGKGTAAEYLVGNYHAKHLAHSDILYDILAMLHLPSSRDNAIKLSALRETFGQDVLINALNANIAKLDAPIAVITGIRFDNELKNIRSYPDNTILYITAPPDIRHQRQIQRAVRADDKTMTFGEFIDLEQRNTEVGIVELGKQADYTIDNSGTMKEFHAALDKIMTEIL